MKLIKLLIIVLSLSMPIQSYACWDDDWDDNYDPWDDEDDPWSDDDNDWSAWEINLPEVDIFPENNNDDDYCWEIDLPEVDIFPNNDSDDNSEGNNGFDNEWENNSWNDDNEDIDWGDDEEPSIGSNETNINKSNFTFLGIYSPSKNEVDINRKSLKKLPAQWPSQYTQMGCVSTVLEYASNYLRGSLTPESYELYRTTFELEYHQLFKDDLTQHGVLIENMGTFLTACGFDVEKVIIAHEIVGYISDGYPIIASIKNGSNGNTAHEVLIVGYFSDTEELRTVNPSNGSYENHKLDDLYSKSIFAIKNYE